jgi:hypothetical protein
VHLEKENVMRSIGTLFCLVVLGAAGCAQVDSTDTAQEEISASDSADVGTTEGEPASNPATAADEALAMTEPLVKEEVDEMATAEAPTPNFMELWWNVPFLSHKYFGCQMGTHGSTLRLNHAPYQIGNGCTHKIWLHQNANLTGYNLCVSPNAIVHLTHVYRSYNVAFVGGRC